MRMMCFQLRIWREVVFVPEENEEIDEIAEDTKDELYREYILLDESVDIAGGQLHFLVSQTSAFSIRWHRGSESGWPPVHRAAIHPPFVV